MGWFRSAVVQGLDRITDAGRRRAVRTLERGGTTTAIHPTGTEVVQFASNDYLGLATHRAVAAAAASAAVEHGTGSGASRLIVGSRAIHDQLEAELAAWKGPLVAPDARALLFPTGYAANLGVLGTIAVAGGSDDTVVLSDELNHASIIDGARLSRLAIDIYPHRDLEELDRRLTHRSRRRAVVVSDLVFSMDGDVAAADELSALCARHDALLVLDIAHDVFCESSRLDPSADVLLVGTLSKTLGSLGGFVIGSGSAVDLLVNTARSFIFSTATAPPAAAAALAALDILRSEEGTDLVGRLRGNVDRLRPGNPSAILPVILGSEQRAMQVSAGLLDRGLLVPAIRPPTVAPGSSRLRVAVSAAHSADDLDRLATALDELGVPIDGPVPVGAGGSVAGGPGTARPPAAHP